MESVPCVCGYNPYDKEVDKDQLHYCPSKEALLNHVTFPCFRDVTDENDPSMVYYSGWDTGVIVTVQRHWCFIGQVVNVMPRLMRFRTFVKTRFGETTSIAFYLDNDQKLPCEIKPGFTLCILYAERKTFLDQSTGIRQEDTEVCWAFRAPFDEVQAEAQSLLKNVDNELSKLCFKCGQVTKTTCGRCKLASYCSVECQRSCWNVHKHLCKDMKKLLGVALLPRKKYEGPFTFQLFEEG